MWRSGRANHVAVVDVASREIKKYILVGNACLGADTERGREAALRRQRPLGRHLDHRHGRASQNVKSVPVGRVPYKVLIDE